MNPADDMTMLPNVALDRLREGNRRFALGQMTHFHTDEGQRLHTLKDGQHPYATILACSDSRVPVEIIFDQGIGDLFVARVAGNVCNPDQIGSIEFGVKHLATPLLVVMGHTDCRAVASVVEHKEMGGSIPRLLTNINMAVSRIKSRNIGISQEQLMNETIKENVRQSIEDLLRGSYGIRGLVDKGSLMIVGAVYDLESGVVEFMEDQPKAWGM